MTGFGPLPGKRPVDGSSNLPRATIARARIAHQILFLGRSTRQLLGQAIGLGESSPARRGPVGQEVTDPGTRIEAVRLCIVWVRNQNKAVHVPTFVGLLLR